MSLHVALGRASVLMQRGFGRTDGSAMKAAAERAARWRARAEEIRTAAESMRHERLTLLALARNYERLAEHIESVAAAQESEVVSAASLAAPLRVPRMA